MPTKITLTKSDIDIINEIIDENNLVCAFDIVYTAGSGIGYCVDIEFPKEINGREAIVRIPVTGVENW